MLIYFCLPGHPPLEKLAVLNLVNRADDVDEKPLGISACPNGCVNCHFVVNFTFKVQVLLFTFSPILSSTGIYGIGGFLKLPRLTLFSCSPFGTVF